MLTLWSAKGGVGCSTVASALALTASRQRGARSRAEVLLVDLGDDLPAVLGIESPTLGVADWLAEPLAAPDALNRIEVPVAPGVQLLPTGSLRRLHALLQSAPDEPAADADTANQNAELTNRGNLDDALPSAASRNAGPTNTGQLEPIVENRSRLMFKLLAADSRLVVVDVGMRRPTMCPGSDVTSDLRERAIAYATDSILVTRLCYLALRGTANFETPNRIVVVAEPGRPLKGSDVARSVGAPVDATVRWDPSVARSVDAGMVAVGIPRSLRVVSSLLRSGHYAT